MRQVEVEALGRSKLRKIVGTDDTAEPSRCRRLSMMSGVFIEVKEFVFQCSFESCQCGSHWSRNDVAKGILNMQC